MTRKKQLIQLSQKAAIESIIKGKVDKKKVEFFINQFKKLPLTEAQMSLISYTKALRLELEKNTLIVESAAPLTTDQCKKIELFIGKQFKIQSIEKVLNPSLLGGFRFKIGDTVFDNSLKHKINQIGQKING